MLDAYSYIIIGAGLSGASAVEGIRERDQEGPVLLLGDEKDLKDGRVRGAMMCNLFGKVDAARELIRRTDHLTAADLCGAIH